MLRDGKTVKEWEATPVIPVPHESLTKDAVRKVGHVVVKPVVKVAEKAPEPVKHAAKATAEVTKKIVTKPVYTEEYLQADADDKAEASDMTIDANTVMAIIGIWAGVISVIAFLLVTGGGTH